jgi:hypothetical protein
MSRTTPERLDPRTLRRCLSAFEREWLLPRPLTHAEASRVESVTIGERINFPLVEKLIGRTLTDNWRARLGL